MKSPISFPLQSIINVIRSCREDNTFVRLLKNVKILFTGNVVSALFTLAGFALTARALGPQDFGILIILQAYPRIIDRLFNFQSWQTLIKYGADALNRKENDEFQGLMKLGFSLDISTAIMGSIIGAWGVRYLSQWYGWDNQLRILAQLYCVVIFFNLSGTPTAILRLFNEFKLFAVQEIFVASIRFLAILIAFLLNSEFSIYFVIWLITDILPFPILLFFGYKKLKQHNFNNIRKQSIRKITKKHKEIWRFIFTTNLATSIRMLSRDLDILIIGGLLGEISAGIFKVAKQFSNILVRLTDPVFYAIYPELAKLWTNCQIKNFVRLVIRSGILIGCVAAGLWLCFLIFGKQLILLTVGPAFITSYRAMMFYMIAIVIAVAVTPLSPAMLSLGKDRSFLFALILATLLYFIVLPSLIMLYSITGASLAYIVFYIAYSAVMIHKLIYHINNKRKTMQD